MIRRFNFLYQTGSYFCLLVFLLLSNACRQHTVKGTSLPARTGSAVIKYAKGFSIDYYKDFKLLNIYSGLGDKPDTLRYVLIGHNDKVPDGFSKDQVIYVPIHNLVTMSSTHVAQAEFAGIADKIIGLGSLNYINSDLVRKNIADGKVKEVGVDGTLNEELLINMKPGLIVVMSSPDAKYSKYKTLTNAGMPVLLNAEWLETTPLGKAEWVKVMAALGNTELLVDKKFAAIEERYLHLAAIGSKAQSKPVAITGMPYKGIWNVPEGDSYMSQFFRDAGISYKWINSKGSGSLSLAFETVAPEALKADYWLNPGFVDTKGDIQAIDPRYASFKPFKSNKVFNYNKRVNDLGSNDYWESGTVNPDIILADLIHIIHPELLPDHKLVYYKRLP